MLSSSIEKQKQDKKMLFMEKIFFYEEPLRSMTTFKRLTTARSENESSYQLVRDKLVVRVNHYLFGFFTVCIFVLL